MELATILSHARLKIKNRAVAALELDGQCYDNEKWAQNNEPGSRAYSVENTSHS
jgi:hypothetical protein